MPPGTQRHRTLAETPWPALPPPSFISPESDEVHLWRIPLGPVPASLAEYEALLPRGELARSERFRFAKDRSAFIIARAALRWLLGNYLGQAPEHLSFRYGPYGKPHLASPAQGHLDFNLSHAGGYALVGISSGQHIGIDLELEDPSIEIERLTKRFFSTAESQQVMALPPADRVAAFFRTWTRKEAFLKAKGAGLNLPLDEFEVTVGLAKPVRIERIAWAPQEAESWAMGSFMVAEALPGAVVVQGQLSALSFYNFSAPGDGWPLLTGLY